LIHSLLLFSRENKEKERTRKLRKKIRKRWRGGGETACGGFP
jgi:hypothetical protein